MDNKGIYFVCEQCGADVQENLIEINKFNENLRLVKEICPFCEGKIVLTTKNKEHNPIHFARDYSHIAPKDLEEIMEDFEDNGYLTERGKEFRNEFWKLFVKEY
jgi:hypothetical protein